eukprot:tig00000128_g7215.t1
MADAAKTITKTTARPKRAAAAAGKSKGIEAARASARAANRRKYVERKIALKERSLRLSPKELRAAALVRQEQAEAGLSAQLGIFHTGPVMPVLDMGGPGNLYWEAVTLDIFRDLVHGALRRTPGYVRHEVCAEDAAELGAEVPEGADSVPWCFGVVSLEMARGESVLNVPAIMLNGTYASGRFLSFHLVSMANQALWLGSGLLVGLGLAGFGAFSLFWRVHSAYGWQASAPVLVLILALLVLYRQLIAVALMGAVVAMGVSQPSHYN